MKEQLAKALTEHGATPLDVGAAGITVAAIFQWLPAISAALTIVWVALRIYIAVRDELFKKKEKE